jgi:hypothetical protein
LAAAFSVFSIDESGRHFDQEVPMEALRNNPSQDGPNNSDYPDWKCGHRKAQSFRLIVDFTVGLKDPKKLGAFFFPWNAHLQTFFETVLNHPEALHTICHYMLIDSLEGWTEHELDEFSGPEEENIFQVVLPFLPEEEQKYWSGLSSEEEVFPSEFRNAINAVFYRFGVSLLQLDVLDSTRGQSIPRHIGRRLQRHASAAKD